MPPIVFPIAVGFLYADRKARCEYPLRQDAGRADVIEFVFADPAPADALNRHC